MDDFHHHLRDSDMLAVTVPLACQQFSRVLAMPNLVPPVVTAADAAAYRSRIEAAMPAGRRFDPVMTLYLVDETTPAMIQEAASAGVAACKLYPQGATTNSQNGVTDLKALYPALREMARCGMLLLVHGETTEGDVFGRESAFLRSTFDGLVRDFSPELKIVLEHCSTADAVETVQRAGSNVAGTITPQHLLCTRNDVLVGGLRPHNYCLPILKTEEDRKALVEAATRGRGRFFMGTDSAPHPRSRKEAPTCSAGCFSSPCAVELYATAFDSVNRLAELPRFVGEYGAAFYGLPSSADPSVVRTLVRAPSQIPDAFALPDDAIIPFMAGNPLPFSLAVQVNH